MDHVRERNEIIEAGRRLYAMRFVASNDGNISIRLSENEVLITPSGVCKGYMDPSELIITDMDGVVRSGCMKPSSEIKMHLAVYRNRNDVKSVVHAHPRKATAFAVARIPLERIALPEMLFSLGRVALAEYGTPTTTALPRSVTDKIHNADALLLANHGALTVGADVMEAYYRMEVLEHCCAILFDARQLGGEVFLDEGEISRLHDIRRDVFGKTPEWLSRQETESV